MCNKWWCRASRVESVNYLLLFFPSFVVSVFVNSFEIAVNELNALSNFHSFNYGGRGNTSGNTSVEHHKKLDSEQLIKYQRPQNHIREVITTNSQGITISNINLLVKVSSAAARLSLRSLSAKVVLQRHS